MKLFSVLFPALLTVLIVLSVQAEIDLRPLSRTNRVRVKRDWLSDLMTRGYQPAYEPPHPMWTGWRCEGTNGIFLDCAGK
ncbi:hypothetical protein L596_002514 [Steinernema carpocapsae]|uniref:Uncharacterized protein n=1 Tax=Steinernema carpocapsae TaxID=34508 RepID=A0A4U8UPJ3_STECR|nr:hypothetical protein L596_002514 [Steinernema carpocapsae]